MSRSPRALVMARVPATLPFKIVPPSLLQVDIHILDSIDFAGVVDLVVDGDPLGDLLVSADDGPGIPQIANTAVSSGPPPLDQNKAASGPPVGRIDGFHLTVHSLADGREQSFNAVWLLLVLLLENLCFWRATSGRFLEQYSETSAPPCPSKMAKKPALFQTILSSATQSDGGRSTIFHLVAVGLVFFLDVGILGDVGRVPDEHPVNPHITIYIKMISELIQTTSIFDSYQFQGAFAEVRKAVFIGDGSCFAIKIFDKKKISRQDLRMYMNQCQIMLSLQHPNIIQIYQVYDNPGYFYIVMEFCQGGELYSSKNLHRCSNQKQIAQIVLTITDALDFCHSHNIVHRDIKPQNIMWTTNDQQAILKIADFGFAKMSTQQLMTTACGTPLYFAPEILLGVPYDNGVDFWSLGVITYILLSGKNPFEAEDERQLFQNIKKGRIDFPEQQWKYISCSAKDFILRLLDYNTKKRYKADKIRVHPWIITDHKEELLYRQRGENLKRYEAGRQVEKIKFIIEKTMNDLSQMQENGEIDLSSMIDEADEIL